ncbi:hypothetical protein V2J09_017992 [Rumex salicifolius]
MRIGQWVEYMAKEESFVPRDRIIEKQKYFQSVPKHTYLKGPYDKITSVAIPLALAISSTLRESIICPMALERKTDDGWTVDLCGARGSSCIINKIDTH